MTDEQPERWAVELTAAMQDERGKAGYKGPVCKGCWSLGNNCKICERCIATKPATPVPDHVEAVDQEADTSWFLFAVRKGGRDVVILDYAPGWEPHNIEFHWEDTFQDDPPSHLAPGSYLWTGFTVGYWGDDDHIKVTGGNFAALTACRAQVEGEIVAWLREEGTLQIDTGYDAGVYGGQGMHFAADQIEAGVKHRSADNAR